MARQLTLLDTPPSWRLDEATKAVGRKGIAAARASLRRPPLADQAGSEAHDHPFQRRSAA